MRGAVSLLAAHAELRGALADRIEQVRSSRRRVVQVADAERQALARRLADGAGARLGGLRWSVDEAWTDVASGVSAGLTQAAEHLRGTAADLAALLAGLRPPELHDGLAPALAALADRAPVLLTVDLQHSGPASAGVEVTAWHVTAEALANVAEHARATPAHIDTSTETARGAPVLVLRISGNGNGDVGPGRGTGNIGLADRVAALGGHLTARGVPDAGTVVPCRMPAAPPTGAPQSR